MSHTYRTPGVTAARIGRNITRLREDQGLRVEQLAKQAGLEAFEVLAFEGGLEVVFAEKLVRLAAALKVHDPERLLEEDGANLEVEHN